MSYNSLDEWPTVSSFFGVVDLKSGSLIVAVLGIVHPAAYCCTCFIPISYLLVSIWILVALYFAASVLLFFGLAQDNETICIAWTVFMALFVVLMGLMLILMALAFIIRKQGQRAFLVFLGLLYYARCGSTEAETSGAERRRVGIDQSLKLSGDKMWISCNMIGRSHTSPLSSARLRLSGAAA